MPSPGRRESPAKPSGWVPGRNPAKGGRGGTGPSDADHRCRRQIGARSGEHSRTRAREHNHPVTLVRGIRTEAAKGGLLMDECRSRTGGAIDAARAVADAILYEGYLLYPYRRSAGKNRIRWQFGVLAPPGWARAHGLVDDGVAGAGESPGPQT